MPGETQKGRQPKGCLPFWSDRIKILSFEKQNRRPAKAGSVSAQIFASEMRACGAKRVHRFREEERRRE